jgi:hypothetical protein
VQASADRDALGDEEEGEHEPHACLDAHRMPANTPLTAVAGIRDPRFEQVDLCGRLGRAAENSAPEREIPGASRAADGHPRTISSAFRDGHVGTNDALAERRETTWLPSCSVCSR